MVEMNFSGGEKDFMYIMVFETGDVYKGKELTHEDYDSWESGLVEFIRISDMKVYCGDGVWDDMNIWDNE